MKKVTSYLILFLLMFSLSCSKDENEVVNTPPVINAQTFSVAENVNDAFVIGKATATDANNDTLSYTIKTDTDNLFEITNAGEISLRAGKTLDYETKKTYTIIVEVSDGTDKMSATITINVTDINENTAPVINAQTFTVAEDITDATEIGAVVATDAENNTLSFSITVNDNDLFEITNDGKLSLANGKNLDFETKTTHAITVQVTDGSLLANNTITINVTDIVEVSADAFITTWKVNSNEELEIKINTNYSYNYSIDWGDGTVENNKTNTPKHTYTTAGTYTVKISGTFPTMHFPGDKLETIEQWGTQEWKLMSSFFRDAKNLKYNATDVPNLSNVTNMDNMFAYATIFNGDISNWNVSNVTHMNSMFEGAENFNQDISNWNVSKVISMIEMFKKADKFNQDLNSWDVSNVTNMVSMFSSTESFNGDISNWNVSNVTNMTEMFYRALKFNVNINNWNVSNVTHMGRMFDSSSEFNQPLNNWNVGNVIDMSFMFSSASKFNQPLNNWNVSNVTTMLRMFNTAENFNQPLNNWNVSNVVDMSFMFNFSKKFNGDVSNWNVSNVTNMNSMFYFAEEFNGDVSNWDVSNVTNMRAMFLSSLVFNADITGWNTSKVTNMIAMFRSATNFSQNLGSWDISKVNGMDVMFESSGMSADKNYTKTLVGWSKLSTVPSGITLGANNVTYCTNYSADADNARDFLINDKGWNITGDTVSNSCN